MDNFPTKPPSLAVIDAALDAAAGHPQASDIAKRMASLAGKIESAARIVCEEDLNRWMVLPNPDSDLSSVWIASTTHRVDNIDYATWTFGASRDIDASAIMRLTLPQDLKGAKLPSPTVEILRQIAPFVLRASMQISQNIPSPSHTDWSTWVWNKLDRYHDWPVRTANKLYPAVHWAPNPIAVERLFISEHDMSRNSPFHPTTWLNPPGIPPAMFLRASHEASVPELSTAFAARPDVTEKDAMTFVRSLHAVETEYGMAT